MLRGARTRQRVIPALAVVVACLGVSACTSTSAIKAGSGSTPPNPRTRGGSVSSPRDASPLGPLSRAQRPSTVTPSAPTVRSGTSAARVRAAAGAKATVSGECGSAVIVTAHRERDVSGDVGAVLVFELGRGSCRVAGYPAVTMLDAHGRRLGTAVTEPRGPLGGLVDGPTASPVTLSATRAVSAVVESSSARSGEAMCTVYAAVSVSLPGSAQSGTVRIDLPSCSTVFVHPLVAGKSGRG